MSTGRSYLEHFTFLVVVQPFVLNAYDRFVFKLSPILLRKHPTSRLSLHLLIPEFLVGKPGKVRTKGEGWKLKMAYESLTDEGENGYQRCSPRDETGELTAYLSQV